MLARALSIVRAAWGVIASIGVLLYLVGALIYWRGHIALFGEEASR